jgi:hypothetical protein
MGRVLLLLVLCSSSIVLAQTAFSVAKGRPVSFQNGRFLAADYAPDIHAGFAVHDANGKMLFDDLVRIPEASKVQIFSIAASLNGRVAVSGMAWDAAGRVAPFLALYSASMSLERVLRMGDFIPRTLVFGADGRIFAFGPERGEDGAWLRSGHCLRVLDAGGKEVSRGLPRSQICREESCLPFEDVSLVAAGQQSIALYIPEVNRIYRFSTVSGEFTSIDGLEVWKRRQPKVMVAMHDDMFVMQHQEINAGEVQAVISCLDGGNSIRRLRLTGPLDVLKGSDGERLLLHRSAEQDFMWTSGCP